jgi:hypothetical protein
VTGTWIYSGHVDHGRGCGCDAAELESWNATWNVFDLVTCCATCSSVAVTWIVEISNGNASWNATVTYAFCGPCLVLPSLSTASRRPPMDLR